MVDIPLLQPRVLNGFIEQKPRPQQLLGLKIVGTRESYPQTAWSYEIERGNNLMSKPNVPNSEAYLRGTQGIGQVAGSFIYMRDKKAFTPTTLWWLRQVGTNALRNATRQVAKEVADLDDSIERFVEWSIWQMLMTGKLSVKRPDAPRVDIDYQVPSTHLVTPGTLWSDTTNASVLDNLTTWTQLIIDDSTFTPNKIYTNTTTFNSYVLKNAEMRALWTDELKREFLSTRTITNLGGFDWTLYDGTYTDDWTTPGSPVSAKYIVDGKLLLLAPDGNPFKIWEGLSADADALIRDANHTGKFAKSWIAPDPSNRTVLEEYAFVPTLQRPYNLAVATVA